MKHFIKLMRPAHYIKNLLICLPIVFSGQLFDSAANLLVLGIGFMAFSLICSCVYIINDLKDCEKDRQHSTKCRRPIASGAVSKGQALTLLGVLLVICTALSALLILRLDSSLMMIGWLVIYFVLNILYSLALKNYPIVDIAILTAGFLLRLLFGSALMGIQVSNWLYLTVMAMAFYLSLGKRRNEVMAYGENTGTRKVLQYYNKQFLDKNMYVSLGLTIIFYALWTVDATTIDSIGSNFLIWTVPLVILICMKYSLNVESVSSGDPVEVLLRDKILIILVLIYILIMFGLLYLR